VLVFAGEQADPFIVSYHCLQAKELPQQGRNDDRAGHVQDLNPRLSLFRRSPEL
jgi:hypothetical protein